MKLLFIAGAGSGKEAWRYQTEYFTNSEAVVFPGHPEGEPCSTIDGYVAWLRDYIHHRRYKDVVLAGHSMGSAIAQLYGLKYPEDIKALVLIGSGARLRVLPSFLAMLKEMTTNKVAWRQYLEDYYRSIDAEFKQEIIEARMGIGPVVALNDFLCCDKFDVIDKVHNIKLPTLVICGSDDDRTPVKYTEYLTSKIEGAIKKIIVGAGHLVTMEKPHEVNQAIEGFLSNLG